MVVCLSLVDIYKSTFVYTVYFSKTRYQSNIIIAGGEDVHFSGFKDILEYDPIEDSMVVVGQMTQIRSAHAVNVVQVKDYAQWLVPAKKGYKCIQN